MRSFEIFVAPHPQTTTATPHAAGFDLARGGSNVPATDTATDAATEAATDNEPTPVAQEDAAGGRPSGPRSPRHARPSGVRIAAASTVRPRETRRVAREVLDIFIEGANVTARVADAQASCVLRDLGLAVADLAHTAHGKAIVRFYDDPWELCIERLGALASLSVYRSGAEPHVAVYDRCVAFDDVVQSSLDAIVQARGFGRAPRPLELELHAAEDALRRIDRSAVANAAAPPLPTPVVLELDRDAPIAFGAEFLLRTRDVLTTDASVERADLHALLFRGRVRADVRGRVFELGESHPFLVAERLLDIARRALDAWERGQALHVRSEAGDLLLGCRVREDGDLALTLGGQKVGRSERALATFPALSVADFVEATLAFGRALVRALLRRDRTQSTNLRLASFRRALRETGDALREAHREDAKVNPRPEAYRAFAEVAKAPANETRTQTPTRLRYATRWRAIVPGIDLRSTFLCGDRLVVGAATETYCLDRSTGGVIWRAPTERATSVVTPQGIARLHADGRLAIHDYGTGEVTLRARLSPRLGGPPAGTVVNLPGLPRLLVLTEGAHHLVALDLLTGEPRWRFAWGNRGSLRLRRAGRLLYFTSGDSALSALDVSNGAVVWRTRDRLRFRTAPTLDHELLFAIAGGAHSAARLHAIDAFSGHTRWARAVRGTLEACTVEGAPLVAGGAAVLALRDRQGLRLSAFDRESGAERWSSPAPVAPIGTSWLAIDDLLIGNTPTGEIVAIDATTGNLRYRHVLGTSVETDVPRRLEPVLRSGALFVPHADVHVLRPRDGAILGTVAPCDAIPDLLRVDERCDVYVAEESGHLVAFGAGPRLALVPTGGSS
jgi:outer membrane protein assembly factor BamB